MSKKHSSKRSSKRKAKSSTKSSPTRPSSNTAKLSASQCAAKSADTAQNTQKAVNPAQQAIKPVQKASLSAVGVSIKDKLSAGTQKLAILHDKLCAFKKKVQQVIAPAVSTCRDKVDARKNVCPKSLHGSFSQPIGYMQSVCLYFRRSRLQLIALLTVLLVMLPMLSFMRVGVAVTVDGRVLGYVADQNEVQKACQELEAESSAVLGEPFQLDADISYQVAVTTQDSFLTPAELPTVIAANVNSLASIAVVTVDGKTIGACAEELQAQQVLDEIQGEAAAGDTSAVVSFVQDVTIETKQAPTELLFSQEDLKNTLQSTSVQEELYTVTETDTMTSIAQQYGMQHQELLDLNPDVIPERMAPGSTVLIAPARPMLSVQTIRTVEYTEDIPYESMIKKDSTLEKGKRNVQQEGIDGLAAVTAEVTEVDGRETRREVVSRTVTREPVDELVTVGSKQTGSATGSLIKPVAGGTMTSGYKYRWGRMHKGIDYGVSIGTSIRAADGGRVVVSEYSKGGYGYYVVIDHGNGMRTLYGHNSQLLVSVGDTVEQGQTIALSGNTGRSTGPHCHFEVIVDGVNVNPAEYI